MFAELATLALVIEAAFGYPPALSSRIGHPVIWIGSAISRCDAALNLSTAPNGIRRLAGIASVMLLILGALLIGFGLHEGAAFIPEPMSIVILAVLSSSLIAQRSLYEHVAAVAAALETGGLVAGREAVGQIVGRNTATLDEAGVCRAAIESLAENFSDGIVAPTFWLTVAGLPGALAYKTVNTADSMIGHLTQRHRDFGWAAARIDDLVNLPASRLASILLSLAALVSKDASASRAMRTAWRDAGKHCSPNAGWPEATMAGALGLKLAGPRFYKETTVQDDWIGDGRSEVEAGDVRRALAIYWWACAIQISCLALIALGLRLI